MIRDYCPVPTKPRIVKNKKLGWMIISADRMIEAVCSSWAEALELALSWSLFR